MQEPIKRILKRIGIYHPLQSWYRRLLSNLEKQVLRSRYKKFKGIGFQCNVCFASYEKFEPSFPAPENKSALVTNKVIAGYGENIICPNCLSTARERLVIAVLGERNIQGRILHLSPEKNIHKYLSQRAEVISADLEPGFYRSIDHDVQKQDITLLNFKDQEFDMVIGNHILEHIPDDRRAMSEIFRVLKAGSSAILQVPFTEEFPTSEIPGINDQVKQSALFGQRDHVRIYNLEDYIARLQAAGFKVTKREYNSFGEYFKHAIQKGEHFLEITKPTS